MQNRKPHLRRLSLYDVLLLGAAAVYAPLSTAGPNPTSIPHPERLFGLFLVVLAGSICVVWLLARRGVAIRPLVRALFLVILIVMGGGQVVRRLDAPTGLLIVLAIVILTSYVFFRLSENRIIDAILVALAVTLLSGPLIDSYRAWQPLLGRYSVPAEAMPIQLEQKPDIFLVVADGYPGAIQFTQDNGTVNTSLEGQLTALGFDLPRSAWSPYWVTPPAIASILDMNYPLGEQWGPTDQDRLYEMIGGANSVVATLRANGYETYMVESGWSGSNCSLDHFDNCIDSHILDEAMFKTIEQSLFWSWTLRISGGPFVSGARHAMDWIVSNGAAISNSESPTFVFMHMVVPHPPFFLDQDCELSVIPARSSVTFYRDGVPLEERERYFLEQVACVDSFLVRLATIVNDDDVLIYVGDHGTDRRKQLIMSGEDWSTEAIIERMNVLAAVRAPGGCSIGDRLMTVNLMRRLLDCYSSSIIDNVPHRMWISEMVEVESDLVASLVENRD